jgi:hypothetical protein
MATKDMIFQRDALLDGVLAMARRELLVLVAAMHRQDHETMMIANFQLQRSLASARAFAALNPDSRRSTEAPSDASDSVDRMRCILAPIGHRDGAIAWRCRAPGERRLGASAPDHGRGEMTMHGDRAFSKTCQLAQTVILVRDASGAATGTTNTRAEDSNARLA